MTDTAFWDKAAPKYAKDPISNMTAYRETLKRMRAILQPYHRVLEIGCGTGSTALELADGVDRYIGTDVSNGMIQIAQGKLGADTPDHLLFMAKAAGDLPKGPHDVVIALNLLHLLSNLEEVLAQVYDALPSGGLFIAKTGLLKDGLWIIRPIIPLMQFIGKAPFVRNLDKAELLGLMTNAGFVIEEELLQPDIAPRLFTVARKP